ncbi:hypothetical protein HYZ97_04970 [Candidatus Pacearchaeota archaeon]|nr:hypothetical protein [Candidatus Pacearchaeota archaeon]
MYKRGVLIASIFFLFLSFAFAAAQETSGAAPLPDTTIPADTSVPATEADAPPAEATDTSTDTSETSATDLSSDTSPDTSSEESDTADASALDEEPAESQLRGPGITPDSALYGFVEKGILERFRSDLDNVEKKAAEIQAMIEEGKIAEARIALTRFNQYADILEKEIDPDTQEEAKRISAAIRQAIGEIESEIPAEDKEEFVDEVLARTEKIETAAEIAGKIKELCETLSKLDPDQYSRTCKTGDDAPKWQKKLDKDLTDEQKKDAKIFIEVMTQCFKDATKCQCDKIPVKAFADQCAGVVPLYAQCQQGDEAMCEEADKLSEGIEDSLPDYLQEILADLEDEFEGGQYDNHAPRICQEKGAKTRIACTRVMILEGNEDEDGPPQECKQAMIEAIDRGVTSERELRKICEKIMFEENAPEECIAAGITDGRECGKFMFKESAPQECIDAGLTGDRQSDHKKCREIMDGLRGQEGDSHEGEGFGRGPGPGFNMDCKRIENSEERLKCFDGAASFAHQEREEFGDFNDRFKQTQEAQNRCAESCLSQGKAWDFTGGECRCRDSPRREEFRDDNFRREEFRDDFREGPPPEQFDNQGPPPESLPPSEQQPSSTSPSTEGSTSSSSFESTSSSSDTSSSSGSSGDSTSSGTSSSSSSGSSGDSTSSSTSSSSGSGITGNVILNPDLSSNQFIKYFFGK